MSHPAFLLTGEQVDLMASVDTSRCFILYAIVLHFGKFFWSIKLL